MTLHVCWGTFDVKVRRHACREAYLALKEAGHDPEVVKARSVGLLPPVTPGRRRVQELTGQSWVPILELDGREPIAGSQNIIEWARAHPA